MRWLRQLRSLFHRRQVERDLDDEVAFHLAMQAEANRQAGMAGREAHDAARRQFGGVAQQQEACRDRIFGCFGALARDLRYAVRTLRRSPGFTATVLLTLAVGIGAGTAVFCAMDRLLLRRLPYPEPNRLVALHETQTGKGFRPVSLLNLLDWQAQSTAFDAMGGFRLRSFGLSAGVGTPVTVIHVGMVTAGLFRTLGEGPVLGRPFTAAEEAQGASVALIANALWTHRFHRDPGILGRTVHLNEEPYTVIGVLPPEFVFPAPGEHAEAYTPISHRDYGSRAVRPLEAVARLKPGTSLEAARTQLQTIGARLAQAWPEANLHGGADLEPLDEAWKGNLRRPLLLLTAAALLLLAIVCTNVVNLMLSRTLARGREIAIRRALGAGLAGLLRQMAAESVLLSAGGGAVGVLVAFGGLSLFPQLLRVAGVSQPIEALTVDRTALAFAAVLCILVTLLCGLAPALQALAAPNNVGRTPWSARVPLDPLFRQSLVVAQVALSLMLLLSAGLFLRVFLQLASRHPGFDTTHVYKFGFGIPEVRYTEPQLIEFHHRLREKLAAIPGVEAAGATLGLPLDGHTRTSAFQFEGAGLRPTQWAPVARDFADPAYFTAMRIPLLAGRNFSWNTDRPDRPRVLLVNRTFARLYGSDGKLLGRRIQIRFWSDLTPPAQLWEIAGIVGDTYQTGLDQRIRPQIYIPVSQTGLDGGVYLIRTARTDSALPNEIVAAWRAVDPNLERIAVTRLDNLAGESLGGRRLPAVLTALFAGAGLLLTALGLYGIVALEIGQRRREIAIRLALGAGHGSIVRLVLARGLTLTALGAVLGLLAFQAAGKLLASQLYEVAPTDPLNAAVMAAVLLLCTVCACLRPAREALRVQPVSILREM